MSNLTTFSNTQRLNVAFITSPGNGGDASIAFVTGVSGYLANLITVSAAGVSSLNSLSGALNLIGTGNISITQVGQNIYISGSSEAVANLSGYITTGQADSRYYGINNPSGFLTGFNSGLYLLKSETGGFQPTGNYVNSGDLNNYYPVSNPSGFITGVSTGNFALKIDLSQTGSTLDQKINSLSGNNYYLSSNPSGFITGISTGGFASVSNLFLTGKLNYELSTGISGYLASLIGGSTAGVSSVNSQTGALNLTGAGNAKVFIDGQLLVISGDVNGLISTGDADNRYYSNSNPSGYITNLSGLSVAFVTGISGSLKSEIDLKLNLSLTGQFADKVALGLTGQSLGARIDQINNATGLFYLNSNPSGFITGISMGGFVTRSETGQFQPSGDYAYTINLFNTGSTLDQKINSLSGNNYYSSSNPSGYLDNLSGLSVTYITGISGALQAQIGGGTKTLCRWIASEKGQPPASGFATLDTQNSVPYLAFADAVTTASVFQDWIPQGANLASGVDVTLAFAGSATSGGVRCDVAFEALTHAISGDSFDTVALGTATTTSTAWLPFPVTILCTALDSLAAGGLFRVRVRRLGTDGADTYAATVGLLAVKIDQVA